MCRPDDFPPYQAAPMTPGHALTMWLDYADELSADPTFLTTMADLGEVTQVATWARVVGLPWPPPPDLDIAFAAAVAHGLEDPRTP